MKKLSRIIMFVVLTLIMLLPAACTITPEKGSNGIIYELDLLTNSYVVVDYQAPKDKVVVDEVNCKFLIPELEIPSSFNGRPVTRIAKGAFRQVYTETRHDYREYLDFSNGKLKIDKFDAASGSRSYYAKIQKIVIPASVKTIEDYAFQGCSELTEVVFDNGISSIGNSAFASCSELETITLTENGETMAGVRNNQLPAGIKKVSDGMFYNCTSLSEVYVPNTVTKIGKLAFASCSALEDVIIEKNDETDFVMVGDETEVDMDDKDGVNVTFIDNFAFMGATAMEYFNVPESVSKFGVSVFEMPTPDVADTTTISSLKGVSFSSAIKELGSGMFKNCVSLDESKLDLSQIEKIGDGIFEGCTSLSSVQLNGMIEQIPARAYYGCTGIETIDLTKYYDSDTNSYLPTKINYIGEAAFRGCSALRSIELGDDTTSKIKDIKRYAFKDCFSLRSIYIPLTVIRIDPRVFENSGGTVIYAKDISSASTEQVVRAPGWNNGSANLIKNFIGVEKVQDGSNKVVAEYVILDKPGGGDDAANTPDDPADNYASLARYVDFDNSDYTVPATIPYKGYNLPVEGVLKAAFKNCDSLATVYFDANSNISAIESESFANTTNVKTLDLSVTKVAVVPERAFAYSKNLEGVVLPTTVTEIKESAFEGCSSLLSMDISAVKTIGKAVFKDCSKLESVVFGAITAFPEQIFFNASSLKAITVAEIDKVTTIRARAFYGCSALNETNFPTSALAGLTDIGAEAFNGCSGYKTFHIPEKLKTIGDKAFAGCTSLASFTIDTENINFEVSDTNILYAVNNYNSGAGLPVKYYKTAADMAVGKPEAVTVNIPYSFYSNLVYYPANSESTSLQIDMKNTLTLEKIYEMVKGHAGGDVYAYTAVPTKLSIFNKGRDFITADGKIYTIATSGPKNGKTISKITEKSVAPEDGDYLAGSLDVARIANYAFEGAINLETVEFYGDVTLGTGVFNNCPKLKSITVMQASTMDKYANVDDGNIKGVLYQGSYVEGEDGNYTFVPKTLIQFPSGAEVEEFIVPETVEGFGVQAFAMAKRIDKLVLSNKIGWSSDHGVDKAFINANIGEIVIDCEAAWVSEKNKEGVENHSLQINSEEIEDPLKVIARSNGKFIIDEYGILYGVNIGSETITVDGVTTTTRFIQYNSLIYVPSDIDLSNKTLTIPNGCTVNPYAFSKNSTLKTIILGRKVSMVGNSFDGCNDLTILYQSGRIDFEDLGYLDDKNFVDANGYETNLAFKNAQVYYFSEDMISSDEYKFWHYKSAIKDAATGDKHTYDAATDERVPSALDGETVFYQDNEYLANFEYEYQLWVNPETGKYEQDEYNNWIRETNNFGEDQFVIEYWN